MVAVGIKNKMQEQRCRYIYYEVEDIIKQQMDTLAFDQESVWTLCSTKAMTSVSQFVLRIFTDFTCQILISYKYILHSTTAYYNPAKYVFNASTYFIMALRPVSVILQMVRGFTPEPSVVFDI